MPILPPEPFCLPGNPFEDLHGEPRDAATSGWFVAHTKSRAEKALARRLHAASVQYFLPLYRHQVRVRGRAQVTYQPLFPGYLFVRGGTDARHLALATNQVARCLPAIDEERLVADLHGVYRLMTTEFPLTPVSQVPPGAPVEVIDGPFAGLTGRVIRSGPQARLVIEVRMIRQGVSVELDLTAVRPLTNASDADRARQALIRG